MFCFHTRVNYLDECITSSFVLASLCLTDQHPFHTSLQSLNIRPTNHKSLNIQDHPVPITAPTLTQVAEVQSGFKPRDSYQWSKYPKNPQIISLDTSNGGAPRPTQAQPQPQVLHSQVMGYSQTNPTSNGIHPPPSHTTASHIAPLSHNNNTNSGILAPMSQVTL